MIKTADFYSVNLFSQFDSRSVPRSYFFTRLSFLVSLLIVIAAVSGCGSSKSKEQPPSNIGGGFTLLASGGTLNDGSGVNGLAVLVTLRDSRGWGPTQTWTISITGPDIPSGSPIVLEYADSRRGSYMSWEWAEFDPAPGTYRATATNGSITIYDEFTITSATLPRPAPNATSSGNTITVSWPGISEAGSYDYEICSPTWNCFTGMITTTSETVSFETLSTGDYVIQVRAYATDRIALYADHSSSPGHASQERVSEYTFSFPVGGNQSTDSYSLDATGGVLDFGLRGPGNTIISGIAFWTSIQDITSPGNPIAPAGAWNITITDPNGMVLDFIYPADRRHDAMWYYSVEPVPGSYTVTATYGTASKTATFTIAGSAPEVTPRLTLPGGISATKNASTGDMTITWDPVSGAGSYYVSLYAEIRDNSAAQYDYREVWGKWVSTSSATIMKSESAIPAGLACDVYITAHEVDITSAAPPATAPARADLSENYYGYTLPFLTP